MRKFLKFLSQRIVIVTFLIFLQVLWFVGLFLKFTSYSQYITAAFKILSILVVIYIMNRSDNPSVKLVWVIVILLFPLFGGLLYLTIGGKQPISYLRKKLEPMIEESERHLKIDPQIEEGEEQHLLDRYGNQMLYYKAALEQILEKRVREIYLYSFSLKKFISVEKILTSISGE